MVATTTVDSGNGVLCSKSFEKLLFSEQEIENKTDEIAEK